MLIRPISPRIKKKTNQNKPGKRHGVVFAKPKGDLWIEKFTEAFDTKRKVTPMESRPKKPKIVPHTHSDEEVFEGLFKIDMDDDEPDSEWE